MTRSRKGNASPEATTASEGETTGDKTVMTRRQMLGTYFCSMLGAGASFTLTSDSLGYETPVRIDRSGKHVTLQLGATALYEGTERADYLEPSNLRTALKAHAQQIAQATNGQFSFEVVGVAPDIREDPTGRVTKRNGTRAKAYGIDQVRGAAAWVKRRFGRGVLPCVFVDDNGTAGPGEGDHSYVLDFFACLAPPREDDMKDDGSTGREGNTIAHELLHLLGLGHQAQFEALAYDTDGTTERVCAVGTIQELLRKGCGLKRSLNGEVDQYGSSASVMGSLSWKKMETSESPMPIITPPEQAYLNQSLKVQPILAQPGIYHLSYQPGETFAVTMNLPRDHALRYSEGMDTIDTLFFGLAINSCSLPSSDTDIDMGYVPLTDDTIFGKTVALYGTSETDRKTVAFANGGVANMLIEAEAAERFVYADEQLGVLVTCGEDEAGHYVRVRDLATEESQRLLAGAQKAAAKTNQDLVEAYNLRSAG